MTEVADEGWNRCLQPQLPRQLRQQRLQPFAAIVAKVMNLLGKEGYELPGILVRLTSEGLNEPKSMTQIKFLDVVLIPVGFAILLQRMPALFGVPSDHFEPFTEGQPFLGVEMTSVENLRFVLSDQPKVGVAE